jgi:hypothetical protein
LSVHTPTVFKGLLNIRGMLISLRVFLLNRFR